MKTIDKDVLESYNTGKEKGRLYKGIGLVEFARTKEVLCEQLPKPKAVVYDIGGAYGEYSYYLTDLGYDVYLYDLSKKILKCRRRWAANSEYLLNALKLLTPDRFLVPITALTQFSFSALCIILWKEKNAIYV